MDQNIPEPIIPSDDKGKAQKEQDDLFIKRIKRQDEIEGIGHKLTKIILPAIVIVLGVIGIIRVSFLVLPECWKWIDHEGLMKIDEFFIHGTIGAILVEFMKGKMSSKKSE